MTESIRVIDDFLPTEVFELLASNIMEIDGYKCSDFAVREDEVDGSKYQFGNMNPNPNSKLHESSATFILFQKDINPKRDLMHHLYFYLQKEIDILKDRLNVKQMSIMRATCTFATQENYVSSFHTDFNLHPYQEKMRTAILYLNSNNGGTQIKDGQFVQSKANRIAIFPWEQEHAGVWCTDKKLRFVLNLNYTEN